MPSFVTHLESSIDGTVHPHDRLQTTHAGRPLLVRYDLDAVARAVDRDELARRGPSLWRYRELLPVESEANVVSLGEARTPLLDCPRLARELGVGQLLVKDESLLPTGSFKARGMALAVSRAKELGATRLAAPSAGNAGGALAAYAARAGLEAWIFLPADTPLVNRLEPSLFGARAFLVDGLIDDCGRLVREGTEAMGWFDLSTLKEPYRLEGKKTMGLELAEQLGWRLPDAILYPTGGGTGLVGMAKAFDELESLGWLEDTARPRFYACQSSGCSPIVRAFEAGERHADHFEGAHTIASGLRVPAAVGDFLILDAVRASGGAAVAAEEREIMPWTRRAAALEGISLCPEAGACLVAAEQLVARGALGRADEVVLFNTGAAQKYAEALEVELPRLSLEAGVDWEVLAG